MATREKRSEVWKHFTTSQEDDSKAICLYCGAVISRGGSCRSSYTTTNMLHHVKTRHPQQFAFAESTSQACSTEREHSVAGPSQKKVKVSLLQPTLQDVVEKKLLYNSNDPRAQEFTTLIAEMICVDMQPYDIVNNDGFRRLMSKAVPRYNIPSRKHMADTVIPKMYEKVKNKVRERLSNLVNVAVTTDLWTSEASSQMNDFISVTAHEAELSQKVHFCLEVLPFDGDLHTAVNIADNLLHIFEDWEIGNKVCAVVTDNASNMKCAVRDHLKRPNIPCLAHSVQLVLKDGLLNQRPVRELLAAFRSIVGHFSHSTAAKKILVDAQKKVNEPQHVLIQDIATRWDSTLQMLRRLVEQRLSITVALQNCSKFRCQITAENWLLAEQLVDLLTYFEDVTKTVSSEKACVADAIPLVNSLNHMLEMKIMEVKAVKGATKSFATDLKHSLGSRLGELEKTEIFLVATMLDPRYKHHPFQNPDSIETVKNSLNYSMTLQKCDQTSESTGTSRCYTEGNLADVPENG
ncbi:zinc finger BED domain-containing protein 4-like [Bacillus rossius redtenbacheri]|uniref:zinc finger BED domain-containing protein 4-like n=1 Tax=Bacillus rossius redtenbacheri TaxID=93214 RepID=UPI002FDE7E4A